MNFLKWKLKHIYTSVYTRFLDLIKGPEKARHEFAYWVWRKAQEGTLSNAHYKYFYTEHFGLPDSFFTKKKILDIGCGPRGSLEWANMCSERIGLDPLAKSYRALGTDKHEMAYVASSSECMPFKDGCFDVVSSFNSLDHVDDVDQTIREIIRVIAPRGLFLLLTDMNHDPTICEPIQFSWNIVSKFTAALRVIKERHYEKGQRSMYESIHAGVPYNHSNPEKRYSVLSAKFMKSSKRKPTYFEANLDRSIEAEKNTHLRPHIR